MLKEKKENREARGVTKRHDKCDILVAVKRGGVISH